MNVRALVVVDAKSDTALKAVYSGGHVFEIILGVFPVLNLVIR